MVVNQRGHQKIMGLKALSIFSLCYFIFSTTPVWSEVDTKERPFFSRVLRAISIVAVDKEADSQVSVVIPFEKTQKYVAKPSPKPQVSQVQIKEQDFIFPAILTVSPQKRPLPVSHDVRLGLKDRQLYQDIFALQNQGKWNDADIKINKLEDMRLLGYIAYQRYKHPKYNSSVEELRDWLDVYGDYAGAYGIYRLANRKFKTGFKKPKKQKTFAHKVVLQSGHEVKPYISKKKLSRTKRKDIRTLKRNIARDLGRDAPTRALTRLNDSESAKLLDQTEQDILRADIAAAYFYLSLFDKAKILAVLAADRSGDTAPLAGWIAGLCAWHQQDYKAAGGYFEKSATSVRSSDWMRSAASYWAARSYVRSRSPHKAAYWLKNASLYPRSFYGLISMQSLGMKQHSYDWSLPKEKEDVYTAPILKIENGYRTISLLDAGQMHWAMEEMRRIHLDSNNTELKEALFVLASRYNMPGMAMQLASTVKRQNGKLYDTALYPVSPWRPTNGFTVSPTLVHAFIRQESRFNPYATSRSGATGLMQLMPTTASYLAKKPKSYFKNKDGKDKLLDPVFNMTLGQKYLNKLLRHPAIDDNLFQLIAAYNAGPGRLSRWKNNMAKNKHMSDDPLLFIEMLPAAETRAFVEQVMANYWIYSLRFYGRTPNSLEVVASAQWPLYSQDKHIELADRRRRGYINQ